MRPRTIIYLLLLSTILLILTLCSKNPLDNFFYPPIEEAVDTTIPDSTKTAYYEDAAGLVLRNISEKQPPSVNLPAAKVQHVYNALIHIYNARHIPERDTIIRLHRIHTAPTPHPGKIVVKFDSSAVWADNWQHNIQESGNAELTDLMTTYNITIPVYYFWGEFHGACLRTEKPVNTRILAHLFKEIKGIHEAEQVYEPSETDIRLTTGSFFWNFRFSLSLSEYWNFIVYRDGTVKFAEAR